MEKTLEVKNNRVPIALENQDVYIHLYIDGELT